MAPRPSLATFLVRHPQVICARLTRVRGSSPRGEGAFMLVSDSDIWGSIGGGQLEHLVIQSARDMLAKEVAQQDLDVPLGPEINQCCGGRVEVTLFQPSLAQQAALMAEEEAALSKLPHVYVFGAGHVGRAICDLLQFMPVRTLLVDERGAEQARCDADVARSHTILPDSIPRTAPPGSAAIVLTHQHATDFLIAAEALAHESFCYVGMIGSKTKKAQFRKWLEQSGGGDDFDRLVCPIGATTSTDKRPAVIASFVVAEVMERLSMASDVAAPERAADTAAQAFGG